MTPALPVLAAVLVLQVPHASVSGWVVDAGTNSPLGAVEVGLTDLDRWATTDSAGRYELVDVPPGPQHVTVSRLGYSTRTVHALVPAEGPLEINFSLEIDPIPMAQIDVRSRVEMRGLDSPRGFFSADREVSQAAIRVHPMLAEPDAFQALAGGEVVLDPESPTGIHIRGGRADQTAYLLDGVPVFSPYHSAGIFSAWNPDALSDLSMVSSLPSPAFPDALSGTISGTTRRPGTSLRGQGALSTGQARITLDGPLGEGGYLLSLRSGFTGTMAPREPEYLRGETGDQLGKIEMPALGGRFSVLAYGSENELGASSLLADEPFDPGTASRSRFEWRSQSLGATWTREVGSLGIRAQLWNASSYAASVWHSRAGPRDLDANRSDGGLLFAVERTSGEGRGELGFRVERSRTSYGTLAPEGQSPGFGLDTTTPVAALFSSLSRALTSDVRVEIGSTMGVAAGRRFFGPRGRIRWRSSDEFAIEGSYSRSHQFAQSLQNAESLAGYVFPAHLYVGAGDPRVPIARGDLGVLAVEWTPRSELRLEAQAFSRGMHGLTLVAPHEAGPFSDGSFSVGSGTATGASVGASVASSRYGFLASYGWQSVRLEAAERDYAPSHGTEHLLDAGVVLFPTVTSLIRLSATAGLRRRTSASVGPFEWEACNLVDRGCEFVGVPDLASSPGSTQLPSYLRLDLGARKHWHLNIGGRDAAVAVFGTITNLLGRSNLLTEVVDPISGDVQAIQMRSRTPLVIGLDWQF